MKEKKQKINYIITLGIVNTTNCFNGYIWNLVGLISKDSTHRALGFGFTIVGIGGLLCQFLLMRRDKKKKLKAEAEKQLENPTATEKNEALGSTYNSFLNLYTPGTEEWTKDRLDQIGRRCKIVQPYTTKAIEDIDEINRLGRSIEQFEQIAAKKTLIAQLKTQQTKVKESILQNAHDIVGICTMGEAEANGDLSNEEVHRIIKEVESNRAKLDILKKLMKETGQAAIQNPEDEVFGNIDLESSLKAAQEFNNQSSRKAPF